MIWALFWIAVALLIAWRLSSGYRAAGRDLWTGSAPHPHPIRFLNGGMGVRPSVLGHPVPEAYRYACAFFGTGLIDRAGVLKSGFPVRIDDPIPVDFEGVPPIDRLCLDRARQLADEARALEKPLRLLWSGGIDSTCAAVALITVLGDETDRLDVALSGKSIAEYRKFNKLLRKRGIRRTRIKRIGEALIPGALIVTGEHGDQIFGSMLAADFSPDQLAMPWRDILHPYMAEKIGEAGADAVTAALGPQIAACPIPCATTWEVLWWTNFSMKWNTVSNRIVASLPPEKRTAVAPLMRHFFRTEDFQRWSLANPDRKIGADWASYKFPLKDFIFEFTGDAAYRDSKEKERSLRHLVTKALRRPAAMDVTGTVYSQSRDTSILPGDKRDRIGFDFGE